MRNAARFSISRLAWPLWAGAAVLVGLMCSDPDWDPEVVHGVFASMLLLTGGAITASACRQIEKSIAKTHETTAERIHCRCLRLMADALLATQPSDDDPESGTGEAPALRAVGQ